LADIRAGDAFLSEVFHAVSSGPLWDKTVLVVNYDEWGGFFEHVPPRRVTAGVPIGTSPSSGPDTDLDAEGRTLTGLRVPCIVASPFTRGSPARPSVDHGFFDHTSVLKLIEWRWGLDPLSARDASTAPTDPDNLATALEFARPDPSVPALPRLAPFLSAGCPATLPGLGTPSVGAPHPHGAGDTWAGLRTLATRAGWT
jgi:phospholipase C